MESAYAAFMPIPDAPKAAGDPAIVFERYSEKHPHGELECRSPRKVRNWIDPSTLA